MPSLLQITLLTTDGGGWTDILFQILPFAAILVVMYFLLIRPQQKKDKEAQKLRENLEVGDEVITIGGIIGRVVSLREDTLVIETGSDRSKMRILRSAVAENTTAREKA